jgi:hypothetical protein
MGRCILLRSPIILPAGMIVDSRQLGAPATITERHHEGADHETHLDTGRIQRTVNLAAQRAGSHRAQNRGEPHLTRLKAELALRWRGALGVVAAALTVVGAADCGSAVARASGVAVRSSGAAVAAVRVGADAVGPQPASDTTTITPTRRRCDTCMIAPLSLCARTGD